MGITERGLDGRLTSYKSSERVSMYRIAQIIGVSDRTVDDALQKSRLSVENGKPKHEKGKSTLAILVADFPQLLGILCQMKATDFGDYSLAEALKGSDLASDFSFQTQTGSIVSFEKEGREKPFGAKAFGIYLHRALRSHDIDKKTRAQKALETGIKDASQLRQRPISKREKVVLTLIYGLGITPMPLEDVTREMSLSISKVQQIEQDGLGRVWRSGCVKNVLSAEDLDQIEKLRRIELKAFHALELQKEEKKKKPRSKRTRVKISREMTKVWQRPEQQDRKKRLSDQMKSEKWREIRANRWRRAKSR